MITIEFPNGVARFVTNDTVKKVVMDILLNSPYTVIDALAEDDADGYYLTGEIEKHAWSKDDGSWEERTANEYWDDAMSTLKERFHHDEKAESDNTEKEEKEKEKMINDKNDGIEVEDKKKEDSIEAVNVEKEKSNLRRDFVYERLMENPTDMPIAEQRTATGIALSAYHKYKADLVRKLSVEGEMSVADIAKALEIPEITVKALLKRAKKKRLDRIVHQVSRTIRHAVAKYHYVNIARYFDDELRLAVIKDLEINGYKTFTSRVHIPDHIDTSLMMVVCKNCEFSDIYAVDGVAQRGLVVDLFNTFDA